LERELVMLIQAFIRYTTMEPGTSKENLEDLTQEIVISEFKKNIRAFQKNLASQKSNEGEMNEGSLASIYPPGEFNVLKIVKKRTGEEDKSSYPLEKYIERRGEKAVPKLWKDLPITNHVLKFAVCLSRSVRLSSYRVC